MKDSLFELLLNFFEKTLYHLKIEKTLQSMKSSTKGLPPEIYLKHPNPDSIRVFSDIELQRLTKPSYQFLVQMIRDKIVPPAIMEEIISKLTESSSRYVSLEDTKYAIRNVLATHLSQEQLAFLDLVLYQKEEGVIFH